MRSFTSPAIAQPVGQDGVGGLADERNLVDQVGRDPALKVADDHRIADIEIGEGIGLVEARDNEQTQDRVPVPR